MKMLPDLYIHETSSPTSLYEVAFSPWEFNR